MAEISVAIDENTHRRLRQAKRDDESISDVIDRLLAQNEQNLLRELIGLVDEDGVETVRDRTAAFRADVDETIGRRN